MSRPRTRSAVSIAFVLCLRRAALPAVLGALLAWAGAHWLGPELAGGTKAPGAMTPWLLLPVVLTLGTVVATVITAWPTFCSDAPGRGVGQGAGGADAATGADWIRRLQRGPLRGSGGAMLGALAAQLLLTLPLTTALARALGAPATAAAQHGLEPVAGSPLLDGKHGTLALTLPAEYEIHAIELRPLAGPPGAALLPSRVSLRVAGAPLTAAAATFDQTGQFARLQFEPRRLAQVELVLESGNVPLFFPPGAAVAVEATPRNGFGNGGIAAMLWLVPGFTVLAFANLAGAAAARPTVLTVAFALLFLLSVAGVGPGHGTLLTLLRGHWLPASAVIATSGPTLLAAGLALTASAVLRWRLRR